jgi:hypothetical protein
MSQAFARSFLHQGTPTTGRTSSTRRRATSTVPPGRPPLDPTAPCPAIPGGRCRMDRRPRHRGRRADLAKPRSWRATRAAAPLAHRVQAHDPAAAGELDRLLAGAIEANARTQATHAPWRRSMREHRHSPARMSMRPPPRPEEPPARIEGRIAMRADSLGEAEHGSPGPSAATTPGPLSRAPQSGVLA